MLLHSQSLPCPGPPLRPPARLNGGQMHDGAIFTPAPIALAGADCAWIPAGGAGSLAGQLKGKVAVVTLGRLPSVAIPSPCSYHRLAVAATQAEVAALVLGECCGRCCWAAGLLTAAHGVCMQRTHLLALPPPAPDHRCGSLGPRSCSGAARCGAGAGQLHRRPAQPPEQRQRLLRRPVGGLGALHNGVAHCRRAAAGGAAGGQRQGDRQLHRSGGEPMLWRSLHAAQRMRAVWQGR